MEIKSREDLDSFFEDNFIEWDELYQWLSHVLIYQVNNSNLFEGKVLELEVECDKLIIKLPMHDL